MLKPQEIAEISLGLWYLPLHRVAEIKQLVLKIKQEEGYKEPVDDSDEWTEEDEEDLRRASFERLEREDPWEEPEDV
jgi:hypothetical protein